MAIANNVSVEKYGPWAMITGASSGIGEQFAYQLAENNFNIVLVARSESKLSDVKNNILGKTHVNVKIIAVDLAIEECIDQMISATTDIDIGLVVHSAGYAITGNFAENELEAELGMLSVNCIAPLKLTHYYSNKMMLRKKGGVIFLSSIVGFTAVEKWAGYSATKAYNLLFAESLSYELAAYNIDVMVLCPGPTDTAFFERCGLAPGKGANPVDVVRVALCKLGKKNIVTPGFWNKYNIFWSYLLPRRFNAWFSSMMLKRAMQVRR